MVRPYSLDRWEPTPFFSSCPGSNCPGTARSKRPRGFVRELCMPYLRAQMCTLNVSLCCIFKVAHETHPPLCRVNASGVWPPTFIRARITEPWSRKLRLKPECTPRLFEIGVYTHAHRRNGGKKSQNETEDSFEACIGADYIQDRLTYRSVGWIPHLTQCDVSPFIKQVIRPTEQNFRTQDRSLHLR